MCFTRVVAGLALLANIRLGWKGLPGTNTLAYYGQKEFYNIGPRPKENENSNLFWLQEKEKQQKT
jgi:hypothetical protein